jgi:GcrA cell cycle regulator
MKKNVPVFWTESRIATLQRLCDEGRSISYIAKEMGTTRNAVAGARFRLGMSDPSRSPIKRPSKPKPIVRALSRVEAAAVKAPKGGGVSMLDVIGKRRCHFPMWGNKEAPNFRYCGASTNLHRDYCDHHHRVIYKPEAEVRRERKANQDKPTHFSSKYALSWRAAG